MNLQIYVAKPGKYHLVLDRAGQILLPYSHWLNQLSSDQVSTFAKRVDVIKRLTRFFQISGVDLTRNILENHRLMSLEDARSIRNLCFLKVEKLGAGDQYIRKAYFKLPIHEIERRRNLIVSRNTASLNAQYIGQFLDFFVREFGRSILVNAEYYQYLKEDTKKLIDVISDIRTTSTKHSNEIRSYPIKRFNEITLAIVNAPESVFITPSRRVSQTLRRDQLIALLAAEGLRRGEIGNLMLKDFSERDGRLYVRIRSNLEARELITTNTARAKNKASGRGAAEHYLLLQPTTHHVYREYLECERKRVLSRFGVKAVEAFTGDSWLFANSRGAKQLRSASLIDEAFARAQVGLRELGLLDRADYDPYDFDTTEYGCTPHWFRHSAACAFVATFYASDSADRNNERLFSLMRLRFGWARSSEMPERYAERTLQDETNRLVDYVNDPILSIVSGNDY